MTVNVLSGAPVAVQRLDAQVQVDDPTAPSSEDLPFSGAALRLPTRFVVKLTHDVAAEVGVTLVGADAAGQPIHESGSVTSVPHQDVNLNLFVAGLAGGGGPPADMAGDAGMGVIGPPSADGGTDMASDPCAGCTTPKLCCNNRCVDPSSDPSNCGGCNVVCGSGVCGAALTATMTDGTRPTSWSFNAAPSAAGGALYDTGAKLAVITSDTSNQSGSIIYHDSIVADSFDAHFDFRMSSAGGAHADGAGFLLIKDDGSAAIYTATGLGGSGLGFVSPVALNGTSTLNGYAVELDTYDNDSVNGACGESINGDHVNIDTFAPCSTAGGTVPTPLATPRAFTLVDGSWHTAHVTLAAGKLSVGITQGTSETTLFSNVALTGFKSGDRYYFGFAGGTGQFSERAELRNISVTFPTARCL